MRSFVHLHALFQCCFLLVSCFCGLFDIKIHTRFSRDFFITTVAYHQQSSAQALTCICFTRIYGISLNKKETFSTSCKVLSSGCLQNSQKATQVVTTNRFYNENSTQMFVNDRQASEQSAKCWPSSERTKFVPVSLAVHRSLNNIHSKICVDPVFSWRRGILSRRFHTFPELCRGCLADYNPKRRICSNPRKIIQLRRATQIWAVYW